MISFKELTKLTKPKETMESQATNGKIKRVFLFTFLGECTSFEKTMYIRILNKLGAICKMDEDMYVSDSTHIIVPDEIAEIGKKWSPKFLEL